MPKRDPSDNKAILLTYEGETHTLSEWSRITGVKKGTLWARINNGMPLDKAFGSRDQRKGRLCDKRKSNRMISYRGQEMPLGRWATKLGIGALTLSQRLKLGWSVEEAFSTPVGEVRPSKHIERMAKEAKIARGIEERHATKELERRARELERLAMPPKRKYTYKRYGRKSITNRDEWITWRSMKMRCEDAEDPAWEQYGGRGITICPEWSDDFLNFLRDMGPKPSRAHTIDRFPDNDGNYEPGNCRWATPKEQGRNRRDNVIIDYDGKSLCISEWAEKTGIPWNRIKARLKKGWMPERIFTTPVSSKYDSSHQRHRIHPKS